MNSCAYSLSELKIQFSGETKNPGFHVASEASLRQVSDFGDPLHLCKVKEANVRHKLPRLDEKVVPSLMSVKWSLKKASKSSQSVIKIETEN